MGAYVIRCVPDRDAAPGQIVTAGEHGRTPFLGGRPASKARRRLCGQPGRDTAECTQTLGSGQPCRGSWRTTGLAAATGVDEEPPAVAARASHEPDLGESTAHLTLSSQGLH